MDSAVRDAVRQQGKDRTRNWWWARYRYRYGCTVQYLVEQRAAESLLRPGLFGWRWQHASSPIIRSLIGRRVPNGMRDAGTARAWGGAGGREGQAVPSLLGSSDRVEERKKERHGQLMGS